MARDPFDQNPLEEFLSRLDARRITRLVLAGAIVALVLLTVFTSFYTVQPEGEAVVKRFGEVIAVKPPGLHFKWPLFIDRQYFVPTARVLKQEFGFRTAEADQPTTYRKGTEHQNESLMLTGDLKVIDVEWVVQYRVADPVLYLHRVRERDKTIRDVSEAVMRQIVGNSLGSDVLTEKRVQVALDARKELQRILDDFEMGVQIGTVELQDVTPPDPVKPAFNEVNQAEQEKERFINEAEKRRNELIPRTRGEARRLIESAEGYAAQRVNRAQGEVARFSAILTEYRQSPDVTRRRLYLEMIDDVLPRLGRVFVIEEGRTSPLPLINLDHRSPAPQSPAAPRGDRR
ncbi:MAG: FtsH protease activity modulator HflK [Planctomycetaceae bacterium]